MNESSDFQPKDFVSSVVPKIVSFDHGGEVKRTDWLIGCLKVVEDTLKSKREGFRWNVSIRGYLIHSLKGQLDESSIDALTLRKTRVQYNDCSSEFI